MVRGTGTVVTVVPVVEATGTKYLRTDVPSSVGTWTACGSGSRRGRHAGLAASTCACGGRVIGTHLDVLRRAARLGDRGRDHLGLLEDARGEVGDGGRAGALAVGAVGAGGAGAALVADAVAVVADARVRAQVGEGLGRSAGAEAHGLQGRGHEGAT